MLNKILRYLFRSYARKLMDEANKASEAKFEAYKATLDIKDLIRDRCKGIRLNRCDDVSLLDNHISSLEDEASRLAFLSKAHNIATNEVFKIVADSLIAHSEHQAALYSEDMPNVNFNRATVNGITLFEDEINQLDKQYLSEKGRGTPITEEEKHAIIN